MFDQFRKNFPFDDDRWNDYVSRFKKLEVPAKTVILREGDIPSRVFIVQRGCLRIWVNKDGKDITMQFFFENNFVASLESFKKGTPSPFTIETIEQSTLWYITKKDLDGITAEIMEHAATRQAYLDFVFARTFNYMKHFLSFIKDSPAERYLALIEEHPEIVKRVPQRYIASYLSITTVHLSRVKSKLAKGS